MCYNGNEFNSNFHPLYQNLSFHLSIIHHNVRSLKTTQLNQEMKQTRTLATSSGEVPTWETPNLYLKTLL